jgi:predicted membrane metal-binding protein
MGLVREMAPVVLFFFIAFGLIGLLYKLFVSQFSIEFSAFGKAAIAALIVGKVVMLLDWAQTGQSPRRSHHLQDDHLRASCDRSRVGRADQA